MMRVQAFDPYALAYRSSLLQVATPAGRQAALQRTSAGTRFIVTPLPDVNDTVRIHDTKTSLTWIEHATSRIVRPPRSASRLRARQRRDYIPESSRTLGEDSLYSIGLRYRDADARPL